MPWKRLENSKPGTESWRWVGDDQAGPMLTPAPMPFRSMNREEPQAMAGLESHVMVPAAWAGLTGVFVAMAALPAFLLLAHDVWWLALWLGALSALLVWLARVLKLDIVLWRVESITGADLNRDGQVGQPAPETLRIEVTERTDSGGRVAYLNWPGTEAELTTFARAVLAGAPLAREHWTGAGKPMSRKQFEQLVDRLLELGWVRYRDGGKTQGLELSPAGRAMFRELAGVGRQATPMGIEPPDGGGEVVSGG